MKWISILSGIGCLVVSSIVIIQARNLMWTGKNSVASFIKVTFSKAAIKEEFHKYLNEKDAYLVKMKFRIGGSLLALGIVLLVIGTVF